MSAFSVIIICYNEEQHIAECIKHAQALTEDVVVVDSFSTDATPEICKSLSVNFFQSKWEGYGKQRNIAALQAKYDWILALDADERLTALAAKSIKQLSPLREDTLYSLKRINHLGEKEIKYGSWGRDKVARLYNRNTAEWNLSEVHEKVIGKNGPLSNSITKATISHFTFDNIELLQKSASKYAILSAKQMKNANKKSSTIKAFLHASFKFVKEYFIQLGFLDGKEGFQIAKVNTLETWQKYLLLKDLNKNL